MAKKDYYKILGVSNDADDDAIKKAYRKLAVQYHPDKQVGKTEAEKKNAEEKFKDINEAYQVLSDKEKRHKYDMFGTTDENFSNYSASDIDEIFRRAFGNAAGPHSPFESFFGGGERVKTKGTNIKLNVKVKLSEVYKSANKTVKYTRLKQCPSCNGTGGEGGKTITCPHCKGTGQFVRTQRTPFGYSQEITICPYCGGQGVSAEKKCKHCGGQGVVRVEDSYSFTIPKGLTNNVYFTVDNGGNYSKDGIPGDLVLFFQVESEGGIAVDDRNPYDLTCQKEIPILDCLTGCEASIKHVDGKTYKFNVKQGATDGFVIKLKDKGLLDSNGKRGYLNVVIRQKMPKSLTKDEKNTIDKLKKSKNFK